MNFSVFTAISEIFVSSGVAYLVWQNYSGRGFNAKFALGLVSFEFLVNMLYMTMRMGEHSQSSNADPLFIGLAASHGILSLLTFILLVVYSFLCHADLARGRYYFREHKVQTLIFSVLWILSVGSGEILFFLK